MNFRTNLVASAIVIATLATSTGCASTFDVDPTAEPRSVVCAHLVNAIDGVAGKRVRAVERALTRIGLADAETIDVDLDDLLDYQEDGELTVDHLQEAFEDGDCDSDLLEDLALDIEVTTAPPVNTPLPISVPTTMAEPPVTDAPTTTTGTPTTTVPSAPTEEPSTSSPVPATVTVAGDFVSIDLGVGPLTTAQVAAATDTLGLRGTTPDVLARLSAPAGTPFISDGALLGLEVNARRAVDDLIAYRSANQLTLVPGNDALSTVDAAVSALSSQYSWNVTRAVVTTDGRTEFQASLSRSDEGVFSLVSLSAESADIGVILRIDYSTDSPEMPPFPAEFAVHENITPAAEAGDRAGVLTAWAVMFGLPRFSFFGAPTTEASATIAFTADDPTIAIDAWAESLCNAIGLVAKDDDDYSTCSAADGSYVFAPDWSVSAPTEEVTVATFTSDTLQSAE